MNNKNLFNYFKSESQRNPDLTVFFRKGAEQKDNEGHTHKHDPSMKYSNSEGSLRVYFEQGNTETYHFTKAGEKENAKDKPFLTIKNGKVEQGRENIESLPDRFKTLVNDYIDNRKALGVDNDKPQRNKSTVERS